MSKLPPRRQDNPFILPDSQYRCVVRDCTNHGVWSPMVNGPTWYCRQHAELKDPHPRWTPKAGPYTFEEIAQAKRKVAAFISVAKPIIDNEPSDEWWRRLIIRWRNGEKLLLVQQDMARQAWINSHRPAEWMPPDVEDDEERRAIQDEDK